LMYGGQVSLGIAFTAAMLSISIGVTLGLITGYYGGIIDDILIWFITTLTSIPQLFLLLIVSSILRPGPLGLTLVLGLLSWTGTMRLVRGETLAIREREFVVAARAMGASNRRIMFQHIFPNLISIVIITLALDIGGLILAESALSYLGFGIPQYIPSWGNMLTQAQAYFRSAPHLVFMPGILISVTVLCLYIIGDGIRDALDPTIGD
jgi:peptide/nickel transport system permease protein